MRFTERLSTTIPGEFYRAANFHSRNYIILYERASFATFAWVMRVLKLALGSVEDVQTLPVVSHRAWCWLLKPANWNRTLITCAPRASLSDRGMHYFTAKLSCFNFLSVFASGSRGSGKPPDTQRQPEPINHGFASPQEPRYLLAPTP